mgnify:CR=1 FL=1
MSNIEDDAKVLKNYLKELDDLFSRTHINNTKERNAIRNILSEREQDKARIKALELQNKQLEYYIEELKKYNKTVSDRIIEYKKNSIPKRKVKDYLKKEQERFEVYKKECKTNENLKFGMFKHLGAKNICEKILGIEKNIVTLD